MKDLTDFAVIARNAGEHLSNLKEAKLRVVPLANAPTLSEALGGLSGVGKFNPNQNMTLKADGSISDSNIYSVQHEANGYVRVVARINSETLPGEGSDRDPLKFARGFALLKDVGSAGSADWKVLAVASLKESCHICDPVYEMSTEGKPTETVIGYKGGCYVAFTFSKTNNYQSVSFSPNAFATIEDLDKINGLDGLHIAFDHASGDIKLLDKDGNVLDQANLHMDADTIIADGEEGYKYVKTDVQQDIHAEKDFMPAGKTAGEDVGAEYYAPKTACFLVEVDDVGSDGTAHPIASARNAVSRAEEARNNASEPGDIAKAEAVLAEAKSDLAALELAAVEPLSIESIRKGGSSAIKGIRVYTENGGTRSYVDYTLSGSYNLITGHSGQFLTAGLPTVGDSKAIIEVYSPDAFVWTVGSDVGEEGAEDTRTFAQKMNAAAASMRFHVGDDIPLGTNISNLLATMSKGNATSPLKGFDAEKYMHEGTDSDSIDEQRKLAKEELVAWNAQHPALVHDGLSGTRISSDGVDIRNGKIEIGNGVENEGEDSVKRYVIETDIGDYSEGARAGKGLQIGVIDSLGGETGNEPIQKDILTINAEDYISGAPTCLALLKCSKDTSAGTVSASSASRDGGRITANFTASGVEAGGVFTLTITDNRANNGFGFDPRIVEIIPVYRSGADATEAVPAQRSISAIAMAEPDKLNNNKSTLSIQCSQVIDWAQSIALGGTENGMELYLIVKVY